jgi:hypothetical protein
MARRRKRFQKDNYRLVADPEALTPAELSEIPPSLLSRFTEWWNVRGRGRVPVPPCFSWADEGIGLRYPALERVEMTEGVFRWEVRLRHEEELGPPVWPCLGFREGARTENLPAPLAWLASTFGTATLEPYSSGTAPWGCRLGSMLDDEDNYLLIKNDIDEGLRLPEGCRDWVVLYEADGDAVCADLKTGKTYWTGGECTGEAFTDLQLDGMAATQFILWRLVDDHKISPCDLGMMSAAMAGAEKKRARHLTLGPKSKPKRRPR